MELASKISEWTESLMEFLNGQEWFRQLREKWDELDLQTKTAAKLASIAGVLLLVLFITLNAIWHVHSLRSELIEKRDLLTYLQASSNEMNQLKDSTSGLGRKGGADKDIGGWSSYIESIASSSGIEKGSMTVSAEKPGTESEQAKESLLDITLKKLNVKQLTLFAFNLENGSKPVKIRNMAVDLKNDPSGYMEVTLSISGFTMTPPKF